MQENGDFFSVKCMVYGVEVRDTRIDKSIHFSKNARFACVCAGYALA